mgnify:CR=1 FL=1
MTEDHFKYREKMRILNVLLKVTGAVIGIFSIVMLLVILKHLQINYIVPTVSLMMLLFVRFIIVEIKEEVSCELEQIDRHEKNNNIIISNRDDRL